MFLLVALLATAATAADGAAPGDADPEPAADLSARPGTHAGETRCAACHTTGDWRAVTFDHGRTGFSLTGRHAGARCTGCHPGGDFQGPVPRACAACHRDVHAGRLGTWCDRCHETTAWRQEPAGVEAHRRTAFPLTGRHALLPCEACHGDRRDRAFSRPTPRCLGCHEVDYGARATAAGVDHAAAGFGEDCRRCHGAWRFSPGSYPEHAACFQIASGPHAGIACRQCHVAGLPPIPAGGALGCATDTADCLRCHGLPGIQERHAGVAGFQPFNRRCYECHRFAG
jgi:hypothetical protein